MNKQIEALKMAIDDARIGLGKVRQYLGWQEPKEDELSLEILKAWKTLDACKEALAEAALNEMQKNAEELGLAYCKHGSDSACKECYMEQAEAEKQEPVGKICLGCGTSMSDERLEEEKRHNEYLVSCCPDRQMIDVYTHPATWQSLSDDEINEYWYQSNNDVEGVRLGFTTQQHYFARAVERALKEKNRG